MTLEIPKQLLGEWEFAIDLGGMMPPENSLGADIKKILKIGMTNGNLPGTI